MNCKPKHMGTTGLLQWISESNTMHQTNSRARRARQIIRDRYGEEAVGRLNLCIYELWGKS